MPRRGRERRRKLNHVPNRGACFRRGSEACKTASHALESFLTAFYLSQQHRWMPGMCSCWRDQTGTWLLGGTNKDGDRMENFDSGLQSKIRVQFLYREVPYNLSLAAVQGGMRPKRAFVRMAARNRLMVSQQPHRIPLIMLLGSFLISCYTAASNPNPAVIFSSERRDLRAHWGTDARCRSVATTRKGLNALGFNLELRGGGNTASMQEGVTYSRNSPASGVDIVMAAAERGNTTWIDKLLDEGKGSLEATDFFRRSPLHYAVSARLTLAPPRCSRPPAFSITLFHIVLSACSPGSGQVPACARSVR
eukprot:384472-Rhodomonas_salina.2